MPGVTVKVIFQDVKKLETEALLVVFYEDVRPLKGLAGELDWLLCGSLSSLITNKKMTGSLGDVALLTSQGKVPSKKIFLIGLGPRSRFSVTAVRQAAKTAAVRATGAGIRQAALECFVSPEMTSAAGISALREGLEQGANGRMLDLTLLAQDAAEYEKISQLIQA